MKIVQDKDRGDVAVLENDSHYSKWVQDHHSLCTDRTVPDHLLPLIPVSGTVIDVGANIGTHTVQYAEKVGPGGSIMAFEPYIPSFECLVFNCRALPQVKATCAAVGRAGLGKLLIPSGSNMGAVAIELCPDGDVGIYALDDCKLDQCDFIKIDVEGFELEVLNGAMETLHRCRPHLYVELNDSTLHRMGLTKRDIMVFMDSHNYSHSIFDPKHSLNDAQVDVLFVPK